MKEEIDLLINQIKVETDVFAKSRLINLLVKEKDVRVVEVAKTLQLKPSYVCHIMRLKRVPDIIIDGYYSKMITISHLFIISRLKKDEDMISLYEKILIGNLTVYQTEVCVRQMLYGIDTSGTQMSEKEKADFIARFISGKANVKIDITQTKIKAKVTIGIKGNQKETTKALRGIMKKLIA